ncbi:MAG: SRPBCC family protein [Thermoplasmata archaeon]
MISIKRRASVACRIEDSFEYVADWKNYTNFIPMFLEIEPMSLVHYGPGTSLDVLVSLGKMEIKTALDVSEFQKNKKITIKATKGFRMRATWEFKDIGDKVLITLDFDYDLPAGLTFRADQKELLEKELDDSAVRSMELLKWVLESSCDKNDAH